jgi:catechol 2,3-dioxygenase-like lactoylglutathione lyase family enzyme
MPVLGLQHVNIRTQDLQQTIAFFRDVLSMKVGTSPLSTSTENGAWVFDENDVAIVHLAKASMVYPSDAKLPFEPTQGSGALHHVALECSGYDEILERLKSRGLEFFAHDIPQVQLRQVFVSDPNGILFELNFPGDSN